MVPWHSDNSLTFTLFERVFCKFPWHKTLASFDPMLQVKILTIACDPGHAMNVFSVDLHTLKHSDIITFLKLKKNDSCFCKACNKK